MVMTLTLAAFLIAAAVFGIGGYTLGSKVVPRNVKELEARIKYETMQYEAEITRLTVEKNQLTLQVREQINQAAAAREANLLNESTAHRLAQASTKAIDSLQKGQVNQALDTLLHS